jgi:intracellular sulfur oxidation DsrE/DsrF family protein
MQLSSPRTARGVALTATALALSFALLGFTPGSSSTPTDAWLKGLTGKHKQIFDSPAIGDGIPLIHVMNFYDTYNKAYGVKDSDIDAVFTFYGQTTFHGLNDAMWAKYKLGEFLKQNDAAGQPAVVNPWRTTPLILGGAVPPSSIESLQKRGATFIICNNALTILSGLVAKSRGLEPTAVYEDMKGNILPGVELVPAMVIAIGQAQAAGATYLRN